MPLSAVDFVPLTGQIKAASHRQYFDLFTGVMTDQPVTFANTLQVGGSQGAGVPPIRIVGVAAQTANMIEARALAADVQPIFSVGPTGTLSWGPGAAVGPDVSLRRSAPNQLTLQGLAGTPALVIPVGGLQVSAGNLGIGTPPIAQVGIQMPSGYSINASGTNAFGANISPTLVAAANNDILFGLQIIPTFNDNAKTGVTHVGLRVGSGNVDFTGTGTVIANLPNPSPSPVNTGQALTAGAWNGWNGVPATLAANATYFVWYQAHFVDTSATSGYKVEFGLWTSDFVTEYDRSFCYGQASTYFGGTGVVAITTGASAVNVTMRFFPNAACTANPAYGGTFSRIVAVRIA